MKFPVLKLSQAMAAILAQFKDPKGTILVMKRPDPKKDYQMEIVYKLETLVQSFTTFASTVIQMDGTIDQIVIATPSYDKMHQPLVRMLNSAANDIQEQIVIEGGRSVNSNNKEGMDKKGPMPMPKKEPAKKQEQNPNVRVIDID